MAGTAKYEPTQQLLCQFYRYFAKIKRFGSNWVSFPTALVHVKVNVNKTVANCWLSENFNWHECKTLVNI